MKHLGLFEGIGGFSLAARWAGWHTPVMVEWNQYCQLVLNKNFPDATIFGDIRQFDGRPYAGQIDIITGGFPCQPYSTAGKRKGNDDDRALWPEMLRIIRDVAPAWVVGENVAGLLSMDGGRVFSGILTDLENEGYCTETYLIPAIGVGAPHERYRVWIVAYNSRIGRMRGQDNERGQAAGGIRIGWQNQGVIADAYMQRRKEQHMPSEPSGSGFNSGSTDSLTADSPRIEERKPYHQAHPLNAGRQAWENFSRGDWGIHWHEVATRTCRVGDGLPAGVDGTGSVPARAKKGKAHRLEAIGNAIVPEIAFQIFDAINKFESDE